MNTLNITINLILVESLFAVLAFMTYSFHRYSVVPHNI